MINDWLPKDFKVEVLDELNDDNTLTIRLIYDGPQATPEQEAEAQDLIHRFFTNSLPPTEDTE